MNLTSDLEKVIRRFALHNAFLHHGKANDKAVLGKILADRLDLRPQVKELLVEITAIVSEINSKSESTIKNELEVLAPELLHKEKQEKHIELPELENIGSDKQVVMRFAPGPSGPLHIGHSRAIILNDEYVKRYSGKFILRLEDTNPQNIEPDAYDMIQEDLGWLGVKYNEMYRQSDRFGIYLKFAQELLSLGCAYICTCPVEHWRELKSNGQACPDRELPVFDHLERWEKMMAREYEPGQVSYIVKTDLTHPNPAVRDFVGYRIVEHPHPLTNDKYYIYPTYNFSVAIDDHLMGITHILRGKDHLNNTIRQKYVYNYMGWQLPEFLHYGWVSLPDVILKTSVIKDGIRSGKYTDWSDIQLGTLRALSRRGIHPEAIRKYWLDMGVKDVDITFSWETLYAINKDLVDKNANRYFFVWDPVEIIITDATKLVGHAPLQPDNPSKGTRNTVLVKEKCKISRPGSDSGLGLNPGTEQKIDGIRIYVPVDDIETLQAGTKIRLKDLGNIELISVDPKNISTAKYLDNDLGILKTGVKIIHWISVNDNFQITIYLPDGSYKEGYCENDTVKSLGSIIQFERFGFVQLGSSTSPLIGWFAHK